jgi:hypothetical protein
VSAPIRPVDPSHLETIERAEHRGRSSRASFDRLAFALRAIDVLRPPGTDIVVYPSSRLEVQQGRDLRRGNAARWALVGIPRDASAASIALALLEIEGTPQRPITLELVLAAADAAERAN